MTDGTATDRAPMTGAQLAAADLTVGIGHITDRIDGLVDAHRGALFDRALTAADSSAYATYLSGQLAALLDRLRSDVRTLGVYADCYRREADAGKLDTAEDRAERVRRMVVASTYTAAAKAGRDRFGAALDELESMLAARKAATDPAAATDDDDDGSFLRTLQQCVDLWLSSTVDADAEAEDATATTRAMQ